jgi:hypothetical protein
VVWHPSRGALTVRQEAEADAAGGPAPSWAGEPMGSGSLDRIQLWLDQNPRASSHWRNEAHLKLAEGRLAFGEEGIASSPTASANASARLARAEAEFRRVLDDPQASSRSVAGPNEASPKPAAGARSASRRRCR